MLAQPLDMIVEVMQRNSGRLRGYQVFLFGSRAQDRARLRSDFDIGVIGPSPLPVHDFYAIEDELEALPTLHSIDWVDFGHVSPRFRENAMKSIKVIYE